MPDQPVIIAAVCPFLVSSAVFFSLLVFDCNSTDWTIATLQVTGNDQAAQEVLPAATSMEMTNSFAASAGTLALSGISSLVNYQTILR